jgi:hypothetical protein
MSTRGIYGVRVDGKDKISYNHSDSYPDGLGVSMLGQARKLMKRKDGLAKAKEAARAIRMVGDRDVPTAEDIEKFGDKMNLSVSSQSPTEWYCLLRDSQGDLIANLDMGVMIDSGDFILDSLFCEWGYILNLDTMKLEVYRGFQSAPHGKGRFAKAGTEDHGGVSDKFYPCALVAEFDLRKLPTKAAFLKDE